MKKIMKFWCVALALAFAMPAQAQWSKDPKENKELLDKHYWGVETQATSTGGFYMVTVHPDADAEDPIHHIVALLFRFDSDGKPVWDKPVKCDIDSTMSWIKVMSHLFVDRDDNAIIMHQSLCGDQIEKFTAWKISKDGEQLWGDNGIILHGDDIPGMYAAAVRCTQMENGEYVFAWMDGGIKVQKVTSDGKLLWGTGKIVASGAYPHVMDAGDGDILIVYESSGLNVCRIDFEGNQIWDIKAFGGQLNPQIPSWTYVHVYPVEDPAGRGVLISYYGFVGDEFYPYISYVKADGTHAFPDADAGLRICYSENWGMEPSLAYDQDSKSIYAIFQERAPGTQFTQRFVAQKISEGGELLWGNEGKELIPLKERTTGYASATMGSKGNVLFAFMENVGLGISEADPIHCKAAYMDKDGKFLWDEELKPICSYGTKNQSGVTKYSLEVLPYNAETEQWICVWEDCRTTQSMDGTMFGQNLYRDGSMGPDKPEIKDDDTTKPVNPTAVEDLLAVKSALRVTPNPVQTVAQVVYTAVQDQDVRIDLVGTNGLKVMNVYEGRMQAGENTVTWQRPALLPAGMYVMQLTAGDQVAMTKVMVL